MATLKPPESQLLKTLISILTSEKTHLLETLNPYIPQITQPLLSSLLSSPSLAKKPETLLSFFQWAQTSIPEAFPSSAREVFDDVVKIGVAVNVKTFNVLVNGYCLEGKLDDAVGMLERMVSEFNVHPDNVTYNTILKAMSKKGRLNDVKELLLDMKKNGLVPNRVTYNNLVYGYCKLGSLKEAFQIVELMKQTNVLPDLLTYNMLINGLCSGKYRGSS